MRNLVQFIARNVHWLFFFLLLFVSVFSLVKNNQFQRSKYLNASQEVAGRVNTVTSGIGAYLHLKTENEELTQRVAELNRLNTLYKDLLETKTGLSSEEIENLIPDKADYEFVPTKVVYNSTVRKNNYFTIQKGSNDGITPDMGVLSASGIAGVTVNVNPNFSSVISVLNSGFQPSCMIKNSNYFGPLVWDGKDAEYSYLQQLPRHVEFQLGDTVITSGHSAVFPAGIPVGTIVDSQKQENDNFTSLKIKLFTNFHTLTNAIVVINKNAEEQRTLQKEIE